MPVPEKYIITATNDSVSLIRRRSIHNGFMDTKIDDGFTRVADALQEIAYDSDGIGLNHYFIEVNDQRTNS